MTLIFDWDGTLHNTLHLYGKAFRIAYRELVESGYASSKYYSDEEMSQESDFKVAQVHSLKSIGCGYGFGTQAELNMADFVVQSCREIPHCIRK